MTTESIQEVVNRTLKEVKALAAMQGKFTGFCIGNTRKMDSTGMYFSPIRNTTHVVAGSVIVYDVNQTKVITQCVDGLVDYILVDTEKKISREMYGPDNIGNVERAVRENVRKSKILTFKGNDLTADSIEAMLVQILPTYPRGVSGKQVTIIGCGNLGSKLALKLVEQGIRVIVTRRNENALKAIVTALNLIKPIETQALVVGMSDNEAACRDSDVVIGMTNGVAAITPSMIASLAPNGIVIDAGKGCIHPDAVAEADRLGLPIYRVDIRPGFESQMALAFETEKLLTKIRAGKKIIEGVTIVAGGTLAKANEVIVDDADHPTSVFGIANGLGDFIRTPSKDQANWLEIVKRHILARRKPEML